jgi:hypothetical protein
MDPAMIAVWNGTFGAVCAHNCMTKTFTIFCSILLAAAVGTARADGTDAASPAETASGPSTDEIARWIGDLDSNQYRVRETATQQLVTAGPSAISPLVATANGKNPEPADRAIWILRQLGQATDRSLALAALTGLSTLRERPAIAQQAVEALDRLREQICAESLAKLGGKLQIVVEPTADFAPAQIVDVVLDEHWQGSAEDLKCVTALEHRTCFKLEGASVGDAEARLFGDLDRLQLLKLINTHVSADAIDTIKAHCPKATIYMKNKALFGIMGASHAQGVVVQSVQPGTAAAAAGVLQGDVITQLDGQPLPDFDRLTARIAQHAPGDEVDVQIQRGDDRVTKHVKLGAWASVEQP